MDEYQPQETQKTQPKGKGKPVDIPVPERADVERDLRKLIAPERPSDADGSQK